MYINKELFLDFLKEREVTWLGIDFSKATFTRKGFDMPNDVLQLYLNEWNALIISDQKKYDIRVAFRKPIVYFDLSYIKKQNKLHKGDIIIRDVVRMKNLLDENLIANYVRQITLPALSKYALLFIVESFDNTIKKGSVWVNILKSDTKELIFSDKFTESPGGFNIKSYWARIFYNIFFNISRTTYLQWEHLVMEEMIR
ncbi:MAG: hypothetical protein FWF70_02865 [Bacteroidetes bacterium]|nr:hypothetical protein [Bacteroidota bacterium]MCL1968941.1 hypothetical protein [Bacteroidota bacterium]